MQAALTVPMPHTHSCNGHVLRWLPNSVCCMADRYIRRGYTTEHHMSDMGKSFVRVQDCYSVGVHHCHNIREGMGHSLVASTVGANRSHVNRLAM